mgnify:CR=1 FL=1
MSNQSTPQSIDDALKQLAQSGISFGIDSDNVVVYMDMRTLIEVALIAFKTSGLVYTYDLDPVKQVVKVKIPAESFKSFLRSNIKDPNQLSAVQRLFNIIDYNKL